MILKIGFDPERVIHRADDHILIHIPNYDALNRGCYVATVEGETQEQFNQNKARSIATVLIGQRGGIVVERHH